jgi:hypothetical protein
MDKWQGHSDIIDMSQENVCYCYGGQKCVTKPKEKQGDTEVQVRKKKRDGEGGGPLADSSWK